MTKKIIIVFTLLYIFVLLQVSFFVHLFPQGMVPNLVLILVLILSIFERPGSYLSSASAVFGGLLLDVYSEGFIGFWIFLLLGFSLVTKTILERYVRISIPQKI